MLFKTGIVQPKYPNNFHQSSETINDMLYYIKNMSGYLDLIILPEYSNCPGAGSRAGALKSLDTNLGFYKQLCNIAAEKNVNIAANLLLNKNGNLYNTTVLIDRNGCKVYEYNKTHLSYNEIKEFGIKAGSEIGFFLLEGIRICFATCFELYFAEYFEIISYYKPDIIIIPSYQRSEYSDILRRQASGRALDAEAYILRSSYSMGKNSIKGGCSLVASPEGEIIMDAGQDYGLFFCSFEIGLKRKRPAAYDLEEYGSRQIIEKFRNASLYRISGPSCRSSNLPFPRIIAHRGLSGLCPENTLPSFGAAVAAGAHEIEFDIWGSKDNKLVICHDKSIDRTSNGKGDICNLEWSFLSKLDTGCWFGKEWENIPFCTLEDVFKNFAGQVVMNIHLKESGKNGWIIKIVRDLAFEYEMSSKIYITGDKDVLKYCLKYAPDIERCCLEGQEDMTIVEWAINYKCRRLQFAKNKFNTKMIEKAHTNNIICNLSYTDTVEEAARALEKGINAILTNYCNRLLPIIPIEI